MTDVTAAQPQASIFDTRAPIYRAAGYRVAPSGPGTKYPAIHQGFGSYIPLVGCPTSNVTDPHPGAGIGFICGDPPLAAAIGSRGQAVAIQLIYHLHPG